MYNKAIKEGQPLPKDVYKDVYSYKSDATGEYYSFYKIYEPDLTADEVSEYLTYRKLALLTTIKNCLVFFTALTIISLVAAFFAGINAF